MRNHDDLDHLTFLERQIGKDEAIRVRDRDVFLVTMNGADGKPETTAGRAVTIWRREPDGEWRCAVDIWNGPPPPPD